jgi:quercetin dioxygenase-like cupin family protein
MLNPDQRARLDQSLLGRRPIGTGSVPDNRRGKETWTLVKHALLFAAGALLHTPAHASETDNAKITALARPVLTTDVTATGQLIVLPTANVRVVISIYDIAADAVLPEHEHRYARYGYVLAGAIRVTNTDTGQSNVYKTGDFIIEAIGQWNEATALDHSPVTLLVIDQVAGDQENTIIRMLFWARWAGLQETRDANRPHARLNQSLLPRRPIGTRSEPNDRRGPESGRLAIRIAYSPHRRRPGARAAPMELQ